MLKKFDGIPGVTGHGSQVKGHVKTLKFKQLKPNTKLDTGGAKDDGGSRSHRGLKEVELTCCLL